MNSIDSFSTQFSTETTSNYTQLNEYSAFNNEFTSQITFHKNIDYSMENYNQQRLETTNILIENFQSKSNCFSTYCNCCHLPIIDKFILKVFF